MGTFRELLTYGELQKGRGPGLYFIGLRRVSTIKKLLPSGRVVAE